jgi:hypothetical protein
MNRGDNVSRGLLLLTAALVVAIGALAMTRTATHDVLRQAKGSAGKRAVSVTMSEVRLSRTHVLVFRFQVHGNDQISKGFWYLFPWRDVILEK